MEENPPPTKREISEDRVGSSCCWKKRRQHLWNCSQPQICLASPTIIPCPHFISYCNIYTPQHNKCFKMAMRVAWHGPSANTNTNKWGSFSLATSHSSWQCPSPCFLNDTNKGHTHTSTITRRQRMRWSACRSELLQRRSRCPC